MSIPSTLRGLVLRTGAAGRENRTAERAVQSPGSRPAETPPPNRMRPFLPRARGDPLSKENHHVERHLSRLRKAGLQVDHQGHPGTCLLYTSDAADE